MSGSSLGPRPSDHPQTRQVGKGLGARRALPQLRLGSLNPTVSSFPLPDRPPDTHVYKGAPTQCSETC